MPSLIVTVQLGAFEPKLALRNNASRARAGTLSWTRIDLSPSKALSATSSYENTFSYSTPSTPLTIAFLCGMTNTKGRVAPGTACSLMMKGHPVILAHPGKVQSSSSQ